MERKEAEKHKTEVLSSQQKEHSKLSQNTVCGRITKTFLVSSNVH